MRFERVACAGLLVLSGWSPWPASTTANVSATASPRSVLAAWGPSDGGALGSFARSGARPGDATFGNAVLAATTSAAHGGAIYSLRYRGAELVTPGTGTDFQTAYSLNWQVEGLNPTEAGSADDALFTRQEADSILGGDRSYCLNSASYDAA